MIKLQIEQGLENTWHHSIDYQINYLLAPVINEIKSGKVNFYTYKDSCKSNDVLFYCNMTGKDKFGQKFHFSMKNSDGKLAIKDTISRVRRELMRKKKRMNS